MYDIFKNVTLQYLVRLQNIKSIIPLNKEPINLHSLLNIKYFHKIYESQKLVKFIFQN